MAKPDLRAKVIISLNGDSRELLDLIKTGHEFYAARSGCNSHFSYHRSGRTHTKLISRETKDHEYVNIQYSNPIEKFRGHKTLASMSIDNLSQWYKNSDLLKKYYGKKINSLLKIDANNLLENEELIIHVGIAKNLLEINRALKKIQHEQKCILIGKSTIKDNNLNIIMFALAHKRIRNTKNKISLSLTCTGNIFTIMTPDGDFGPPPIEALADRNTANINISREMPKEKIKIISSPFNESTAEAFDLKLITLINPEHWIIQLVAIPKGVFGAFNKANLAAHLQSGFQTNLLFGSVIIFDARFMSDKQVNIQGQNYHFSLKSSHIETARRVLHPFCDPLPEFITYKRIVEFEVIKIPR